MIKLKKPFKQDFRITQGFGENPSTYSWIKDINGVSIKGHNGIDFGYAGNNSVELFNPFPTGHDVVISKVGWDEKGYGWYIRIWDKTQRFVILMAHGMKALKQEWESVKYNEMVMIGDNTGWSTGPHLHLAGYYVDEAGSKLNRTNGYDGFVNLMDTSQFNWVDEIKDWKEYFLFDVTKQLPEDIYVGLNFIKATNFPRETSLDSIHRIWNEIYIDAEHINALNDNLEEVNKNLNDEITLAQTKTAVAEKKYVDLEIKYNKLKAEKDIDLEQALGFILDWFKRKLGV
jgi:hypothetical protein